MKNKGLTREGNFRYINPTPGELPIMASTVTIDDSEVIPEDIFRAVRDCGFNLANCFLGAGALPASLNNAYAQGIRVFLSNTSLNQKKETVTPFVNSYRNNPGLGGWSLADEPSYDQLTETQEKKDPETGTTEYPLKSRFDWIRETDKNHLIYISLLGCTKGVSYNGHTYTEYLRAYQDNFGPQLWSYDVYPISQINYMLYRDNSNANGTVIVNRERFYDNFEKFSAKARETGVPFWAYCQSVEAFTGQKLYMPMGLEQYLRFEAFSALAYGAQGLVYWTYRCRNFGYYDENGNPVFGTELYLSAPKSRDDRTLPYWHYARRVNAEIRKFEHVFLGCELREVRHAGNTYDVTTPLQGGLGPINHITVTGEGVLLSHLTNNGKDYFVIVSHDPVNPQEIIIYLNQNEVVSELTPVKSNGAAPGAMSTSTEGVKRTLIPGGHIIMEWRNPS